MIVELIGWIYTNGLQNLVDRLSPEDIKDLTFLYDVLKECEYPMTEFAKHFGECIKRNCENCIKSFSSEKNSILQLLDIKDSTNNVINKSFRDDEYISSTVKDIFFHSINNKADIIVKYLVQYIDGKLSTSKKNRGCEKFSTRVTFSSLYVTVDLLRVINAKDKFERVYHKLLSRRLLCGLSKCLLTERQFVLLLKSIYGSEVSFKFEKMVDEIKNPDFYTTEVCPDVKVLMLAKAYWPYHYKIDLVLPKELRDKIPIIEDNYHSERKHKTLIWKNFYGSVEMSYCINNEEVDLTVSVVQAVILEKFNTKSSYSLSELLKLIKTNNTYVFMKAIESLTSDECPLLMYYEEDINKANLLNKNLVLNEKINVKDIKTNLYSLHMRAINFDSSLIHKGSRKIKRTKKTQLSETDLTFNIEAFIMRNIKSQNTMTHDQLHTIMNEFFQREIGEDMFKDRINSLLDREFITTCEENGELYYKYAD